MQKVTLRWCNGKEIEEVFNHTDEAFSFITNAVEKGIKNGWDYPVIATEFVPVEEKICSACGCKTIWEHPDIPGYALASSCYEPGFDMCHECLIEHCMQTNCLQCELQKYPDCRFIPTKKLYLQEQENKGKEQVL